MKNKSEIESLNILEKKIFNYCICCRKRVVMTLRKGSYQCQCGITYSPMDWPEPEKGRCLICNKIIKIKNYEKHAEFHVKNANKEELRQFLIRAEEDKLCLKHRIKQMETEINQLMKLLNEK